MKQLVLKALSFLILIFFTSCSSDGEKSESVSSGQKAIPVVGRWVLMKSEDTETRKRNYQNQPSDIILNIDENGFFMIYDTLTDPEWRKKGLPLIQKRKSGQWKLEDSVLTMFYQNKDSTHTQKLRIVRCTESELVTERSNKKVLIYKTYGKK